MSDIKMVMRDKIPCWYELSLYSDKKEKAADILIRIHSDVANCVKGISFKKVSKHMKRENFEGEFGRNIGFNKTLKYLGEKDNFLEYLVPIPITDKVSEKKCADCDGTGNFNGNECLFCKEGKAICVDYRDADAVCASLSLLLSTINNFSSTLETSARNFQLMCVRTRFVFGGELYIGGELSREVVDYLIRSAIVRPGWYDIAVSMQMVFQAAQREFYKDFQDRYFKVSIKRDGSLFAECPGDGSFLYTQNQLLRGCYGYELSSHGIDTPVQHLTFVAALAAIHDHVRADQ